MIEKMYCETCYWWDEMVEDNTGKCVKYGLCRYHEPEQVGNGAVDLGFGVTENTDRCPSWTTFKTCVVCGKLCMVGYDEVISEKEPIHWDCEKNKKCGIGG